MYNDLKAFIVEHNLITYSVSWVVAVTFTLFIQSAVGDILLPSLYYLTQAFKMAFGFKDETTSSVDSIFEKVNKINVANFLKETITLVLILLVLYVLIKDVINNWAKIPSSGSSGSSGGGLIGSTENNTTITKQPFYFSSGGSTGVSSGGTSSPDRTGG